MKIMFTVFTTSGLEMVLEDAGQDAGGNQLWRQIKVDDSGNGQTPARQITSCWPAWTGEDPWPGDAVQDAWR